MDATLTSKEGKADLIQRLKSRPHITMVGHVCTTPFLEPDHLP